MKIANGKIDITENVFVDLISDKRYKMQNGVVYKGEKVGNGEVKFVATKITPETLMRRVSIGDYIPLSELTSVRKRNPHKPKGYYR